MEVLLQRHLHGLGGGLPELGGANRVPEKSKGPTDRDWRPEEKKLDADIDDLSPRQCARGRYGEKAGEKTAIQNAQRVREHLRRGGTRDP